MLIGRYGTHLHVKQPVLTFLLPNRPLKVTVFSCIMAMIALVTGNVRGKNENKVTRDVHDA
jgi:hypothetical protein